LNLYWDGLNGQKFILYVPNNGHGLKDFQRVAGGLLALHRHATGAQALPKVEWHFDRKAEELSLKIDSDQEPERVSIWLSESETRDFRDSNWRSTEAKRNGQGWEYTLHVPTNGYAAVFGEAVYGDGPFPLFLSTNVRIVHGKDGEAERETPAGGH
jgi:PhoPQ-activated pathogenicity-related protein